MLLRFLLSFALLSKTTSDDSLRTRALDCTFFGMLLIIDITDLDCKADRHAYGRSELSDP